MNYKFFFKGNRLHSNGWVPNLYADIYGHHSFEFPQGRVQECAAHMVYRFYSTIPGFWRCFVDRTDFSGERKDFLKMCKWWFEKEYPRAIAIQPFGNLDRLEEDIQRKFPLSFIADVLEENKLL
jgi:hypothetical protein